MKKIILLIFVLNSFFVLAQKVKFKNKEILVEDIVWMKYQDCGTFDQTCSILNSKNEEVIFIKFITVPGIEPITSANSKGSLYYQEIKFLGFNKSFEVQKRQKDIIQLLYNSKVINENGEVDQDKAAILVEKYGQEFSARINNKQNNQTIIIQQPEPRRSGININLGR